MSATQAPNPREFKTWEDAFQFPVPAVRRMEQQLRVNINENRDKLRTLVGTSYRDLLLTAERIVLMDDQMHKVETNLGDIGQKCNTRAIEKIALNHQRMAKAQRDRSLGRNALASNIALLQNCMNQATYIIKGSQSPLRAAKLLVLARLLYTSASKSPDPPALLEALKSRLASLRRRLLNHVEKSLLSDHSPKIDLVETLAAFSLATTSTPTDVLHHFLQVRATALSDLVESPSQADLYDAMSLLIATLKDVRAVFPKQLASLLGRLQNEPILQDAGVRDMSELNLDLYERWIADDVRNFTPWLRHDQLQLSAAASLLKIWATKAKDTLLDGLRTLLSTMDDVHAIVTLRKDLLLSSLSADRKLPGLDPIAFFEELRSCFLDRLRSIAIQSTNDITMIVSQFVTDLPVNEHAIDPWDPENLDVEVGKGAINFRNLVHNSYQGKGVRLQELEKSLTAWTSKLASFSSTIKAMREDRWTDDLDLDIEDDFEIDSPQDLLAREDPDNLRSLLATEKDKSLAQVYDKVQSVASSTPDGVASPVLLLRLLREVVTRASSIEDSGGISRPPHALFESLHTKLVQQLLGYKSKPPGLFVRLPPISLWEGHPPLPIQPSPASFRYLHETCRTMKGVGSDIWTPSAVTALKIQLRKTVIDSLANLSASKQQTNETPRLEHEHEDKIDGGKEPSTTAEAAPASEAAPENTEESTSEEADTANPKHIQATFDLLYLDKMLGLPASQKLPQSFEGAVAQTVVKAALTDAALERLRKNSVDYYKRTYLLFGLLAV